MKVYRIITAPTAERLEVLVNEQIHKGAQLVGGAFALNANALGQAMLVHEKK